MDDDRAARIAEIRAVASSKMLRDALAEIDRLTAERDAALAREAVLVGAVNALFDNRRQDVAGFDVGDFCANDVIHLGQVLKALYPGGSDAR